MRSAAWQGDWQITQAFGCTSLTVEPWWAQAQCHWHCGVDIGMPVGTPLYSLRPGRVIALGYGELGIQALGRTEVDFFIHIDRSVVGLGQLVAAGVLVAYSGAKVPSGGSLTGPHLHFEVNTGHLNEPDSSIDPMPVLQQTFGPGSGTLTGDEMTQDEFDTRLQSNAEWQEVLADVRAIAKAIPANLISRLDALEKGGTASPAPPTKISGTITGTLS